MRIAIRPEEERKKVLVKVIPTCPNTKTLGDYSVNLDTNRKGGIVIPFLYYAMSWYDSELEFYDKETNERLGEYIPPKVEQDIKGQESMAELAGSIRDLVNFVSAQTKPVDTSLTDLIQSIKVLVSTLVPQQGVPIPITQNGKEDKVEEITKLHWKKQIAQVKTLPINTVKEVKKRIEDKRNKGKADEQILVAISERLQKNGATQDANKEAFIIVVPEEENIDKIPIFTVTLPGPNEPMLKRS